MWQAAVSDFSAYLSLEKGVSSHTHMAYIGDVNQFLTFLGKNLLSSEHVSAFSRYLFDREFTASSISRKLSALKQFIEFLYREGYLSQTVTMKITKPKKAKRLPKALPRELIDRLFLGKISTLFPYRDRLILELLYAAGLRVGELPLLTLDQVAYEGVLKVVGKGNKERLIPMAKVLKRALEAYLDKERLLIKNRCKTTLLLLNSRGNRISRQSIYLMIKRRALEVGLKEKVTPHMLRHSFASHLLDGEADIRAVQAMLGHAHISTTEIYLHISKKKVREGYDRFHPRA